VLPYIDVLDVAVSWYLTLMESDRHSDEETEQRLQKVLQSAFSGPPTPLKDIPKGNGESRSLKRKKLSFGVQF
jgi:hypothetical protein